MQPQGAARKSSAPVAVSGPPVPGPPPPKGTE